MSKLPLVVLLLLALQACTSPAPLPEDRFYDLRPAGVRPENRGEQKPVHLVVRRPRADTLRGARNLVFSPDGVEMRQYHHRFWADRPDRVLESVLLQQLRTSGLFSSVGSLPVEQRQNAELQSEILRLDRVRSGAGWKVDVALRFTYHPRRGEPAAFTRLYHRKLKTGDDSMQATIRAFNQVMGEILRQLVQDLDET